jgi:iron complex outermembrane recepter protein
MVRFQNIAHARLLATTVLTSAILAASPAVAQDDQAPATTDTAAAETGQDEQIIVTGTLVRNPNLVASSPVNVVGEEEIELQQANVAEELLRELPGAVPSQGSAVNNGNAGSAFADLRGLGSNRNIALIDGVRLAPANLAGVFDLNNIPLALIQRVDVLTGGASTTYGADAVSGVVNFITRTDFAGIDINLSEQITEQGDGNVFRGDVTIGANFDDGRGNAVLSIGYQEADPVYQGARDFSLFQFDSFSGLTSGSGTTVPSTFSNVNTTGTDSVVGQPAVQGVRQSTGTGFSAAVIPFNFNPYNIFQTPFERFNIYGAGRYEMSDAIEIYTRGVFSKNRVSSIVAPSGAFALGVQLSLNSPFLSTAQRNAFCAFDTTPGVGYTPRFTQAECNAAATATGPGDPNYREVTTQLQRRAVEVGPRGRTFTTSFFDYRLGARGNISDSIEWDVFGAYGESDVFRDDNGYVLNSRTRQSLLVRRDANGNVTCQNTANGCVPVNWFGPAGSITPEGVAFLTGGSNLRVNVSLAQARATVSGDFGWSIPWASDAVSFAIGGEFREYQASQVVDQAAKSGDLGGLGAAPQDIAGSYNVYEAFGELIVPIVQNRPFFEELTVEGGIRYSSYSLQAAGSSGFNTTTWKVGGSWAPIDGLRFRGNYARAVRAPNIGELFSPVVTGLTNLSDDPCANLDFDGNPIPGRTVPTGELLAVCLAQGAPAGQIGQIGNPNAGQANVTAGGNLDLEPEKSTSWTMGAVFRPDFAPGLSLSVDYYHILITDAITVPTPDDIITACFGTPAGAQYTPAAGASATDACTSIRRNPLSGQLSGDPVATPGLFAALSNLGRLETSGIDVAASYRRNLGFAGLDLNFVLNWTEQSKFQAVEGISVNRECVGLYSVNCGFSGSLQPEWQWSARATFAFDDIDLSLLWRHIGRMDYENAVANDDPEDDAFEGDIPGFGRQNFNRIPAADYFDLTGRFAVDDHLTITLSVQNLLDKQPPIVGNTIGSTTFNSGNTYPSTYDALGRRFVASARIRF